MAVTRYLVDKSVWVRMVHPGVQAFVQPLIERALIDTCGMVDLEVLFSARNGADHDQIGVERDTLRWLPTYDELWTRAREVQNQLAHRGIHRSVPLPDLLIAAVAERHGSTVLHYDADFDTIAEVTGQPVAWVLPRGSLENTGDS